MKIIKADLHVHTCLSPCADILMLPTAIVKQAKAIGLDMIGICDHNSAENAAAVKKAGQREGLSVIPGIEISSREEVHIMGLFDDVEALERVQALVYENLPGTNDEKVFGPQYVADENDEIFGYTEKLLIGATTLGLEEVIGLIHRMDGVAVASHVDREGFGIIGQLGFIPPGIQLDALEVSPRGSLTQRWNGFPVITGSDAHYLEEIGKSHTQLLVEDATLGELKKALLSQDGRKVVVE